MSIALSLTEEVERYVKNGGEISKLPIEVPRTRKIDEISKVLFFPVQHKFYARNTGISVKRIKALSKNMGDIKDSEIDAIWAFILSRR